MARSSGKVKVVSFQYTRARTAGILCPQNPTLTPLPCIQWAARVFQIRSKCVPNLDQSAAAVFHICSKCLFQFLGVCQRHGQSDRSILTMESNGRVQPGRFSGTSSGRRKMILVSFCWKSRHDSRNVSFIQIHPVEAEITAVKVPDRTGPFFGHF